MLRRSVGLGNRYASLRKENERLVSDANQKLEREVAQRTQEVRAALVQLEEAHGRLRDSSRRDGLTGLYNRTYFHETFEKMLIDSQQSHQAVRSEEHTSELQSLMRISYAVLCLKKKTKTQARKNNT